MRRRLCAVLGALSVAAAAAGAEGAAVFPVSVTDDGGATVRLDHRPQRIVSLTLPTDEILLSLVDTPRLVAITMQAADPVLSNVAKDAARIPAHLSMDAERVISLRPDLVIVAPWSEPGEVALLRETKIPVYMMSTAITVDDVVARIRRLALMTGDQEKGEAMIAAMLRRIGAVERTVAPLPASRRLRALDWASWGGAQGRGSSWDEVVRRAGLINAAAGLTSDRVGQIDCDILILSGGMFGSSGGKPGKVNFRDDPALRGLRAVQTNRVYTIPESLKDATSQYMADAIEWLARAAYPSLFGGTTAAGTSP